jgi:hypothetical protein
MDINSQHQNLLANQISPKSEDLCILGISTVVCGSFWGVEQIQNGGRYHGNQDTERKKEE